MKRCLLLIFALALSAAPTLRAGTEEQTQSAQTSSAQPSPVPLDTFQYNGGYVFESDLNHGGSHGKQDEIQNEMEYAHRIQLTGNWYIHLGLSYNRYDFGSTAAPVPNHLQEMAGVIGVDYMHGKDVGAFIQIRPGFYTQNNIGISSFDVPITVGRIFVIQEDKLYLFGGAYAAFLQGGYPVLPLAGVIWIPSDKVRLMAVFPDPRLIYSPTDKLDLWLGGNFIGGSYRTDSNPGIQPHKLSGAQVDFTDYRVGLGMSYELCKSFTLETSAGASIQRHFAFHRAGENYRTDPSPYVSISLKASF